MTVNQDESAQQCVGGDSILTSRQWLWGCSNDNCDSTRLHFPLCFTKSGKGVADCGKETNTHLFFWSLAWPPSPPTFLIEYVFSTDMFSEIFFLCEETILGCNSQNMSKLRQINGVTRELNVCTLSADFYYHLLLGCLSLHWYFNLTFGPTFGILNMYIHLLNFLSAFKAFCHQIWEGHFFFQPSARPPPSHPWFRIHVPPPPWKAVVLPKFYLI